MGRSRFAMSVVGLAMLASCGEDAVPGLNQDALGDTASVDATADVAQDATDTNADGVDTADTVDTFVDTADDTRVADTSGADTSVADTSVADTSVADTSVADTSVADTSVADTAEVVTPPADPAATGPYGFDEEEDEVEGFAVLRYVPKTTGPFPAVVLVPGFLFGADAFALYGKHLASHGIVTLIPTFGDSAFAPISHSKLADHVRAMAIDLAGDARVDATRVGVAGHSRGGKVAILAAIRDDRPAANRIKAVFGMGHALAGGALRRGDPGRERAGRAAARHRHAASDAS